MSHCNTLSGSCLKRRYWFWKDTNSSAWKPNAWQKMQRLESLGTRTVDSHDNLVRFGTIYPDMVFTRRRWHIVSVSSSEVSTFSIVFVSCSKVCRYGSSSCKQEAYLERFLSDRYGFVPIVFTSSSCKQGLRWERQKTTARYNCKCGCNPPFCKCHPSLEPGPSRAKGCYWRRLLEKGPGVYLQWPIS